MTTHSSYKTAVADGSSSLSYLTTPARQRPSVRRAVPCALRVETRVAQRRRRDPRHLRRAQPRAGIATHAIADEPRERL